MDRTRSEKDYFNRLASCAAFFMKGEKLMEVIDIRIADIIPYENNPRKNEEAIEKVAASIRDFGFKVPIVVDKNNVIVAGHTRLKAAEMLGLETVPVIRADDLNDEQIKAFRLADNKTSEFAEWDFSKLEEELAEISEIDMSEYGFEELEEKTISEEAPEDFQEYDEELETTHKCPKCGYEWS